MIRGMETIYDVFRTLVSKARHTLTDTEVEQALAVIDAHEAAAAKGGEDA